LKESVRKKKKKSAKTHPGKNNERNEGENPDLCG
jgi:hypothetical protein